MSVGRACIPEVASRGSWTTAGAVSARPVRWSTPGASRGEGWGRPLPRLLFWDAPTAGLPSRCWGWRCCGSTHAGPPGEAGASVPMGVTCPRPPPSAASGSCGLHREEDQRAGRVSPESDQQEEASRHPSLFPSCKTAGARCSLLCFLL